MNFAKARYRIALTSGLVRKQVASDLGVSMLTLNKRVACRSTGAISNRMKRELAIRALNMAIALRRLSKAAFVILTVAANIALMIIRKSCVSMALKYL